MQRLLATLDSVRAGRFPVSIEKAVLVTESFRTSEGQPQVIRCAKALASVLDHIPIFLEPDEPVVGNLASKPGGVELSCLWATWGDAELNALCDSGMIVADQDRARIAEMNDYWRERSLTARMIGLYDEERLWPYAQLGVVLPAFRSREEGWGPGGMIGCGWGIHHEISQVIGVFQFEKILERGVLALLADARSELRKTRLFRAADVEKADMLRAIILSYEALLRFAGRFAGLAETTAGRETDPARRAELLSIADICRHVPALPARGFRDAMQSLWFTILVLLPSGVLSFGRFDQYMYPFYRRDVDSGRITDAEVLELLQWLRIKDSQIVITAGQTHRNKYGGLAKWHNWVIGGQTADGLDSTNELSHLVLQAAHECPTPHPTLTMRVHAGTPEPLMRRALELIRTGVGLPAFLGDQSCLDFLTGEGIPLETARGYAVAGCLGINIPGQSRSVAWPMFVAPLVLEFALHGGIDPRSGRQVGPRTPGLDRCASFAEFLAAAQAQLGHFLELQAEFNNVTMRAYGERFPQPVETSLTERGIETGKDLLNRTLPLENGSVLNPIGMINVADSLVAIDRLVFRDKVVSGAELLQVLASNWAGTRGAELRRLALAAPKYGNDDDEADRMAACLYKFWAEKAGTLETTYGGRHKAGSITIGTSNWPGGAATGATPDGREAGECLADESLTPMRGRDRNGIGAVLRSAAKIDQAAWQAMSLDLRLHPDALTTSADLDALSRTIRAYFAAGGKHIQFNVVDNATLRAAQADPDAWRDLIVRIGGCSAYFTQLPAPVQNELLQRSEFHSLSTAAPQ